MALPIPSAPISVPNMATDVGNAYMHDQTKSTIEKAVAFIKRDACDQHTLTKFRTSITINARTSDCELIHSGQLTLSGAIPPNGTMADIESMMAALMIQLTNVIDPAP
jgi:hypothetical protein